MDKLGEEICIGDVITYPHGKGRDIDLCFGMVDAYTDYGLFVVGGGYKRRHIDRTDRVAIVIKNAQYTRIRKWEAQYGGN